jgi:hypothetical protein
VKLDVTFTPVIGQTGALQVSQICAHMLAAAQYIIVAVFQSCLLSYLVRKLYLDIFFDDTLSNLIGSSNQVELVCPHVCVH